MWGRPETIFFSGCLVIHREQQEVHITSSVQIRTDDQFLSELLQAVCVRLPTLLHVLEPGLVEVACREASVVDGPEICVCDVTLWGVGIRWRFISISIWTKQLTCVSARLGEFVRVKENSAAFHLQISHHIRQRFTEYLQKQNITLKN